MKITKTFSLTPAVKDSVVFIEWHASTDDSKVRARWNAFSAKKCSGKDAQGKYYDSKSHATRVIREFKQMEKERVTT